MYPNVAEWTKDFGWIEIGYDDFSRTFIRVIDIGGLVWEGKSKYRSVDEALKAAEKAVAKWLKENQGY